uniref:Uncharacterized protein n=1 Tax=Anguilla anguilla TaxID=7936 RepID=A0A0E9X0V9_ANGAN
MGIIVTKFSTEADWPHFMSACLSVCQSMYLSVKQKSEGRGIQMERLLADVFF